VTEDTVVDMSNKQFERATHACETVTSLQHRPVRIVLALWVDDAESSAVGATRCVATIARLGRLTARESPFSDVVINSTGR